jgi:dephospho-CoA kinase
MIIGIVGQKRSGKDTFANYLVREYGFIKLAFADPIKEIASVMFNINSDDLKKDVLDKEKTMDRFGISLREFYQKFGTEIMQHDIYKYFPNLEHHIPKKKFWVYNIFNQIEKLKKKGNKNFIISDVRFLHEAEHIYQNNGLLIKVDNDNIINTDNHISENSINDIPKHYIKYSINNNSSLDNYYNEIDKLCYIDLKILKVNISEKVNNKEIRYF